ncbi:prolipoprotein diacylglyceryl transferase [Thermodesulfobacteriota bacterium]
MGLDNLERKQANVIPYPNIHPDILRIGPLHIRWYGLMYVLGFLSTYFLIQRQKRSKEVGLVDSMAQDLVVYLAVGLIIGARIGYVIFYQYAEYLYYLTHPLEIIAVWHGGMSFHGGLIGTLVAGWLFCRRNKLPFWAVADSVIVTAPVGLAFGRIGNFINGELFGRISQVAWAMVFPDGGPLPRHPSQLYEAFLEGFILFGILWFLRKKDFKDGMMVVFFLGFYGSFRFFIEFFREPDPQIGLFLSVFSMGQALCAVMILSAVALGIYVRKIDNTSRVPASG